MQDTIFLIGEADMVKGAGMVFAQEEQVCRLQSRGVHQLFQGNNFVIDLGRMDIKPRVRSSGAPTLKNIHRTNAKSGSEEYPRRIRQEPTGNEIKQEGHRTLFLFCHKIEKVSYYRNE